MGVRTRLAGDAARSRSEHGVVVRVWAIPVDDSLDDRCLQLHDDAVRTLSADELERAGEYPAGDRQLAYLLAHLSMRKVLAGHLGMPPAEVPLARAPCVRCGAPHGRPVITGYRDVHVSLTHTQGLIAIAVSTVAVGIDAEPA